MLGHSKEIISADVYGDTAEIIEDCLYAIEPFMEEVLPESREEKYYDYSDLKEIDEAAEEYLIAAWQQYKEEMIKSTDVHPNICAFLFFDLYTFIIIFAIMSERAETGIYKTDCHAR